MAQSAVRLSKRLVMLFMAIIVFVSTLLPGTIVDPAHAAFLPLKRTYIQTTIDTASWEILAGVISYQAGWNSSQIESQRIGADNLNLLAGYETPAEAAYMADATLGKVGGNTSRNLVLSFPGRATSGWFADSTSNDTSRAQLIRNSMIYDLNAAFKFVYGDESGHYVPNVPAGSTVEEQVEQYARDLESFLSHIPGTPGESFGVNGARIAMEVEVPRNPVDADIEAANYGADYYVSITREINGREETRTYLYRMLKGYGVEGTGLPFIAEDSTVYIHWGTLTVEAIINFYSDEELQVTADNVYEGTPGAIEGAVADLFSMFADWVANTLGLWNFDELIFNGGVRGTASYIGGVFPASWERVIWAFFFFAEVAAIIILLYSIIYNVGKKALATIDPVARASAIEQIKYLFIVAFLLAVIPAVLPLMISVSSELTGIFHDALGGNTAEERFHTLASHGGSLGSALTYLLYLGALLYFNVFYVFRSLAIALLIILGPIFVAMMALSENKRQLALAWFKEFCANLFIQPLQALMLSFILLVPATGRNIDSIVMAYVMIPLTNLLRQMFFGNSGGMADRVGAQGQQAGTNVAKTLGRTALGLAGGAIAGGATAAISSVKTAKATREGGQSSDGGGGNGSGGSGSQGGTGRAAGGGVSSSNNSGAGGGAENKAGEKGEKKEKEKAAGGAGGGPVTPGAPGGKTPLSEAAANNAGDAGGNASSGDNRGTGRSSRRTDGDRSGSSFSGGSSSGGSSSGDSSSGSSSSGGSSSGDSSSGSSSSGGSSSGDSSSGSGSSGGSSSGDSSSGSSSSGGSSSGGSSYGSGSAANGSGVATTMRQIGRTAGGMALAIAGGVGLGALSGGINGFMGRRYLDGPGGGGMIHQLSRKAAAKGGSMMAEDITGRRLDGGDFSAGKPAPQAPLTDMERHYQARERAEHYANGGNAFTSSEKGNVLQRGNKDGSSTYSFKNKKAQADSGIDNVGNAGRGAYTATYNKDQLSDNDLSNFEQIQNIMENGTVEEKEALAAAGITGYDPVYQHNDKTGQRELAGATLTYDAEKAQQNFGLGRGGNGTLTSTAQGDAAPSFVPDVNSYLNSNQASVDYGLSQMKKMGYETSYDPMTGMATARMKSADHQQQALPDNMLPAAIAAKTDKNGFTTMEFHKDDLIKGFGGVPTNSNTQVYRDLAAGAAAEGTFVLPTVGGSAAPRNLSASGAAGVQSLQDSGFTMTKRADGSGYDFSAPAQAAAAAPVTGPVASCINSATQTPDGNVSGFIPTETLNSSYVSAAPGQGAGDVPVMPTGAHNAAAALAGQGVTIQPNVSNPGMVDVVAQPGADLSGINNMPPQAAQVLSQLDLQRQAGGPSTVTCEASVFAGVAPAPTSGGGEPSPNRTGKVEFTSDAGPKPSRENAVPQPEASQQTNGSTPDGGGQDGGGNHGFGPLSNRRHPETN